MTNPNDMEAGPEMDAAIAVEVMGGQLEEADGGLHVRMPTGERRAIIHHRYWSVKWFKPSTDIAAAHKVVEWVREQDEDFQHTFYEALAWQWSEWCGDDPVEDNMRMLETSTGLWLALHADIPLAICRAALTAVRARKETQ